MSSGTDAKAAPDGSLSLCWFWLLLIIYTCELGRPSACKAARRGNRRLLLDPAPDLPDDTEINRIQLPTRIRTVLNKAGFKTIGEIRQSSDADLLRLRHSGPALIAFLRKAFGPPS